MTDGKAKGGEARAAALSPEERSEIAKAAANARWSDGDDVPEIVAHAQLADELVLGPISIPCAVLEDGTRVLSERGISKALGRTRSGSHWKKMRDHGAKLPLYLTADNIKPFISSELSKALLEPRWYRSPNGGRPVAGVPATCLPDICDVWLRADEARVLRKPQLKIASAARELQRAFAKTGIVALVDEATGYQEFRAKNELQLLLAAYLSEELLPWAAKFPLVYYKEMFRLWGWAWPPKSGIKGPRYAGKLTKVLIYDHLPPQVMEELESRNPPDDKWQRRNKNHSWLSPGLGQPVLEKQIAIATNLMKVCDSKEEFLEKYERAFPGSFPKSRQMSLLRFLAEDD